jgi:hypothetical protein
VILETHNNIFYMKGDTYNVLYMIKENDGISWNGNRKAWKFDQGWSEEACKELVNKLNVQLQFAENRHKQVALEHAKERAEERREIHDEKRDNAELIAQRSKRFDELKLIHKYQTIFPSSGDCRKCKKNMWLAIDPDTQDSRGPLSCPYCCIAYDD